MDKYQVIPSYDIFSDVGEPMYQIWEMKSFLWFHWKSFVAQYQCKSEAIDIAVNLNKIKEDSK